MSAHALRGKALAWTLGLAAIATQISYPLTHGDARDAVSIAVVLLLAAAATVHAAAVRGGRWTAAFLVITAGGGLLVEVVGTTTGHPFGSYSYAGGRLGPSIAGVPLLIGLAWTVGAYPAWCAAERVAGQRRWLRVVLATVGLAGWDLYLDPQMVADGQWRWARGAATLPGLPDIPLSNYLGWFFTAGAMLLVLDAMTWVLDARTRVLDARTRVLDARTRVPDARTRVPDARPGRHRGHADGLPLTLYLWTWLGSGLAHAVFLGLRASAAYGMAAMGVLGVGVLRSLRRAAPATSGKHPARPGTMGGCNSR